MRGPTGSAALLGSALLLLSGCSGGTNASVVIPSAGPATVDDETGGIEGFVLDSEQVGIPHVEVGIPSLNIVTRTDIVGAFSLSHVPPGRAQVHFAIVGYHYRTMDIDVVVGEVTSGVEVAMVAMVSERPYHKTLIQKGHYGCGVSARPVIGLSACGLLDLVPADTTAYDRFLIVWELLEPTPAWNTSVFEMQWDSNQATGKGLSMIWEVNGCINNNAGRFGSQEGRSPIKLVSQAPKIAAVTKAACQDDCSLVACKVVSRVFAATETLGSAAAADVGVSAQQPFTQYLTAFYHRPASADSTALE